MADIKLKSVTKVDITHDIPNTIINDISNLPKTIPLYHENTYQKSFDSTILKHVTHENLSYIVLDRTCFFPEGGGQPGDTGFLEGSFGKIEVVDTQAVDDIVIHISAKSSKTATEGDPVFGIINWDNRYNRMKQHTASHLIFSAIKKALHLEDLMYMGVQINEDASRIDISYGKPISWDKIREIERLSNRICFENRKVRIQHTNRDEAERIYGKRLGMTEITPSGNVRVVEVDDWDVALCSGTHVESTAEIGLIHIIDKFKLKKGVERIEFTAGIHAFRRYDEAMKRLTDIAQTLETSKNDALVRVNNLLRERDDLKKEQIKVKKQLVEYQVFKLIKQSEKLGKYEIFKKRLTDVDSRSLTRIASKIVENAPFLVVILGSNIGNSAFLVGAAGVHVVEKGINMGEMIRKPAKIIDGGGGGNQKLAQAGGKMPGKLDEALYQYTKEVTLRLSEVKKKQ